MVQNGAIFNVEEPTGAEASAFQTTAAQAQSEAPDASISRVVEKNADAAHDAATDVAHIAQAKGPSLTGDSTTEQLKSTTNKAVAEGQHDVEAAKAASAGYIQQARDAAGNLLGAAQSYLDQTGQDTQHAAGGNSTASTISHVAQQAAAGTAAVLGTAREYIVAGQQATQNTLAGHEGATIGEAGNGVKTTTATVANTVAGHAKAAVNSESASKASSGASSALRTATAYTTSAAQSAGAFVQDQTNTSPNQSAETAPHVQDTGETKSDIPIVKA